MKCRDVLYSVNVLTEVVKKTPKQTKTGESKSLFAFSTCFGWSNGRHHLLLLVLPSGPTAWILQCRTSEGLLWHASCLRCITNRAGIGFPYNKNKPQLPAHSPGLHRQPGCLLWALQCSPGVTNPPLILADTVITGHKRFDDKQHGDKQTARDTEARRPSKSVWIPYRKRRFQNQRNQGGKSWDVCWGHWLAQHPTAVCPASITHCTLLITPTWACVDWKTWKSLTLGETGNPAQLDLYVPLC